MKQEKMILSNNFNLRTLNTWQVGGYCTKLLIPRTIKEATDEYISVKNDKTEIYILGGGSNVLIADGVLDAVIIHTSLLNNLTFKNGNLEKKVRVSVESGFAIKDLLAFAISKNLTGLEFFTGIPGTVGGALWGNAGAGTEGLKNVVTEIETIERNGSIRVWDKQELNWDYRKSPFKSSTFMITKCSFLLKEASKDTVFKKMREYASYKKGQPLGKKTAGCVFKNPEGDFAGILLEGAGCKGLRCGDAIVSHSHANFIENIGSATSSDIFSLAESCKSRVYAKYGVNLEYEIQFFGDFQKKNH